MQSWLGLSVPLVRYMKLEKIVQSILEKYEFSCHSLALIFISNPECLKYNISIFE